MILARIKIKHALERGQPETKVCRRMAEVTISVPVSSIANEITIEGSDLDHLWKTIRAELNTAM